MSKMSTVEHIVEAGRLVLPQSVEKSHYVCRTFDENLPLRYNTLIDKKDDLDHNAVAVVRPFVPDDKISFSVSWPEYVPVDYTAGIVLDKPVWADPVDLSGIKWNTIDNTTDRTSSHGNYGLDERGYPLNPVGRTGVRGRGVLGKWGPNHAADPIVTRWKRDEEGIICRHAESGKQILQFVAICRLDTSQWAIPGGMREPGEKLSKTLLREFMEEATNSLETTEDQNEQVREKLKEFFKNGIRIYAGYVDDPRNTDNAWIETVAYNFHDEDGSVLKNLQLQAGDDAGHVKWMNIDSNLELYASHSSLIEKVVSIHDAHWSD